jgi:hypothetical protein
MRWHFLITRSLWPFLEWFPYLFIARRQMSSAFFVHFDPRRSYWEQTPGAKEKSHHSLNSPAYSCVSITLPASDTEGPRFSFWARLSLFRAAIFQKLRAKRREYDCAIVANRFDRATFHRFFAERFLLRGLWLLVNVGMTPVVVAFETGRCRFATQIAVDALIIDVECPRYVFGVFVCDVGHSFYGKSEIQH